MRRAVCDYRRVGRNTQKRALAWLFGADHGRGSHYDGSRKLGLSASLSIAV